MIWILQSVLLVVAGIVIIKQRRKVARLANTVILYEQATASQDKANDIMYGKLQDAQCRVDALTHEVKSVRSAADEKVRMHYQQVHVAMNRFVGRQFKNKKGPLEHSREWRRLKELCE